MKKVFKSTLTVLLVIILGGCTTTVEKKILLIINPHWKVFYSPKNICRA